MYVNLKTSFKDPRWNTECGKQKIELYHKCIKQPHWRELGKDDDLTLEVDKVASYGGTY